MLKFQVPGRGGEESPPPTMERMAVARGEWCRVSRYFAALHADLSWAACDS